METLTDQTFTAAYVGYSIQPALCAMVTGPAMVTGSLKQYCCSGLILNFLRPEHISINNETSLKRGHAVPFLRLLWTCQPKTHQSHGEIRFWETCVLVSPAARFAQWPRMSNQVYLSADDIGAYPILGEFLIMGAFPIRLRPHFIS